MLRKLAIEYTTVLSNESVRSLRKFFHFNSGHVLQYFVADSDS